MSRVSDPVVTLANIVSTYLVLVALGIWIGVVVRSEGPASTPIELHKSFAAPNSPAMLGSTVEPEVVLLFAGDIMQHAAQAEDDFDDCYGQLASLVSSADLAVANLEFPVNPFAPVGPQPGSVRFNGSMDHLRALRRAGFDVLVTANNHAFDQEEEGLQQTLKSVRRTGMLPVGTASSMGDLDEPLILDLQGVTIGIFAYTYGVNPIIHSPTDITYPPRDLPVQTLNFLNWSGVWRERGLEKLRHHVEKARNAGVNFLLAFCHWGREWEFSPDSDQRRAGHDLIDVGFDLVVGSHGHVLQAPEIYKGKLIAYSLGSLISDFRPWEVRTAAMLEAGLASGEEGVRLVTFSYHPTLVERNTHRVIPLDATTKGVGREAYGLSVQVLGSAALRGPGP